MATTTETQFRRGVEELTIDGKSHPLSGLFVVALRLVIGGVMLFAGIGKVIGEPFDASGYLVHGVDAASPVSGLYAAMASSAMLMDVINVVIPVTQVLIGAALIVGAFVRLAALGGAIQMLAFYLGGWNGELLAMFDSTLVYAAVFLAVAALGAGRVLGVDAYLERMQVGSRTLIERFPVLKYVLG